MKKVFISLFVCLFVLSSNMADPTSRDVSQIVYKINLEQDISKASWRHIKQGFEGAEEEGADIILIQMDTYGGLVVYADSIRTLILDSKIPVYVFIDKNAASAGALISIACDKIFMTHGSTIGAATVVNQTGEPVPDKYQSYMRATMRATAQAHGKDTIVMDNDTTIQWKRDPDIAQSMVDPVISIKGVIDSGQVLTFTADEASQHNFCNGIASDVQEVLRQANISDYKIKEYKPTAMDKIIAFLLNPALQGIFLMLIIGGIYYELQTPGLGFPIAAAIAGAVLYFAPLYLEGLAENWEISLFIVGLILLAVEMFVIPGFGIAGILGVACIIASFTLSLIDNVVFDFQLPSIYIRVLLRSFFFVCFFILFSFVLSLYFSKKLVKARKLKIALNTSQEIAEGYIGVTTQQDKTVGKKGVAHTVLRPSGKVEIEKELYDAVSEYGFINQGEKVKVVRYETGQIYVVKV